MLNTNVEMSNKNIHVVSAYHYPCLRTFLLIVEKNWKFNRFRGCVLCHVGPTLTKGTLYRRSRYLLWGGGNKRSFFLPSDLCPHLATLTMEALYRTGLCHFSPWQRELFTEGHVKVGPTFVVAFATLALSR